MKLSAIIIIAFGIFLNVKIADAKMSGECWIGGKISEQTNVGCRYARSQKYHGLYGLRHSRMYTPVYGNVYRLSTQYKRK